MRAAMLFGGFVVAAGLMATPSGASASLVSVDLFAVGDGLLTHDTVSDLVWLDLDQTRGLSFVQVTSDVGGWMTAGLRFASLAEVSGLWTAAGMVSINSNNDANIPAVDALSALMGSTPAFAGSPFTNTSVYTAQAGGTPGFRLFVSLNNTPTLTHFLSATSLAETSASLPDGRPMHSYLVANIGDISRVPAPGAALGLMGLAPWALRRRRCDASVG